MESFTIQVPSDFANYRLPRWKMSNDSTQSLEIIAGISTYIHKTDEASWWQQGAKALSLLLALLGF